MPTAAVVGAMAVPAGATFCALAMGLYFGGIAGVASPQFALAMMAVGGAIGAVSGVFIARDAARDSMDESLRNPAAPQNFSEKLASYRHNLTNFNNDDALEWQRPQVKPGPAPR